MREPFGFNTINQGRNITHLLIKSHFQDAALLRQRPEGPGGGWKKRIDEDPNIDLEITWGEKSFELRPWEDIVSSTSKRGRVAVKHEGGRLPGSTYSTWTRYVGQGRSAFKSPANVNRDEI